MNASEILKQIEKDIERNTETVEFGKALERLSSNRDFKRVVLDGYFTTEAKRLVHLLSNQNMQTADKQAAIHNQMVGIGQLSQYFNNITLMASQASKAIAAEEEMRDELIAEDVANG